jgi:hypothetical protein
VRNIACLLALIVLCCAWCLVPGRQDMALLSRMLFEAGRVSEALSVLKQLEALIVINQSVCLRVHCDRVLAPLLICHVILCYAGHVVDRDHAALLDSLLRMGQTRGNFSISFTRCFSLLKLMHRSVVALQNFNKYRQQYEELREDAADLHP